MKQMRNNILILDDEYLASNYLFELLENLKKEIIFLNNFSISTSNSYSDFINQLVEKQPAIIFLDIEMPVNNGIDIAKDIRNNYEKYGYSNEVMPIIIFCTAYQEYAFKAYSVHASDYILKPISEESLLYTMNKVFIQNQLYLKDIIQTIKVNHSGVSVDLPLEEVIYFQSELKYINVVCNQKTFLINDTLSDLENKHSNLIRVHRSFLVNSIFISKIFKKNNQWFLSLKNSSIHIPVSRRNKKSIESKLDFNFLID